jgi:hypothetical protein
MFLVCTAAIEVRICHFKCDMMVTEVHSMVLVPPAWGGCLTTIEAAQAAPTSWVRPALQGNPKQPDGWVV